MSEHGKDIERYKSEIEDYASEIKELKAKTVDSEKAIQDARLYLTYATGLVLKIGAGILGIEMPEKM